MALAFGYQKIPRIVLFMLLHFRVNFAVHFSLELQPGTVNNIHQLIKPVGKLHDAGLFTGKHIRRHFLIKPLL